MKRRLTAYWKTLLTVAGGITGGAVVAIAGAAGLDLDPALAAAIATVIAAAAVAFGPRNKAPAPPAGETPALGRMSG